jgi:hypothetical protein
MENHDHEEPKPTNKWLATPIIMAVCVIAILVCFLSSKSGNCCDKKCNDKAPTEHVTGEHATTGEHGDETNMHPEGADSTAATKDSSATVEGHGEHSESEGHGH